MKICQCCGANAPANAPSCAKCGEASWSFPILPVREAPPNVEPAPVEAPAPPVASEPEGAAPLFKSPVRPRKGNGR